MHSRKRRRTRNETISQEVLDPNRHPRSSGRLARSSKPANGAGPLSTLKAAHVAPSYTGSSSVSTSQHEAGRRAVEATKSLHETHHSSGPPPFDALLPVQDFRPEVVLNLLSRIAQSSNSRSGSHVRRKGKSRVKDELQITEEEAHEMRPLGVPILDCLVCTST